MCVGHLKIFTNGFRPCSLNCPSHRLPHHLKNIPSAHAKHLAVITVSFLSLLPDKAKRSLGPVTCPTLSPPNAPAIPTRDCFCFCPTTLLGPAHMWSLPEARFLDSLTNLLHQLREGECFCLFRCLTYFCYLERYLAPSRCQKTVVDWAIRTLLQVR